MITNQKGEELQDEGFEQYIQALKALDIELSIELENRKKILEDLQGFFNDKANWDGSCPIGAIHTEDGCVYPEKS